MIEPPRQRQAMLRAIRADYRRTRAHTGLREPSPAVLDALRAVPREQFCAGDDLDSAHANVARPITCGQTISAPFIVCLMTDLARLWPRARVLDVGTGSGYQAAVLAALGCEVWSVERVAELARTADERLRRLDFDVTVRCADGALGLEEQAPFDGILVAAATPEIAPAWGEQLAPGGRLVVPLGGASGQMLTVVTRDDAGGLQRQSVLSVRFVPFRGGR